MAMLENFDPSTIGNFLASPQAPVVLGQAGAAMMGPQQNSWQAQLGKVAAGLGQSSIAAGEAKAQGQKANDFREWFKTLFPVMMAGGGPTPNGVTGINEVKMDNSGQATIKMDLQNQGNNAPAGSPQGQPVQAPQQTTPVQAVPSFNPRMLPF